MLKISTSALALAALLSLSSLGRAADGPWIENLEAAKAQAAKEGKNLLIDFTGSDWCPWCIRLHQEVFDQEPFKTEAPKLYVLVEIDFPREKEQTDEIKKQNADLNGRFGIEGYPTVFLTDAEGRPYARTGYQAGGAEAYMKHLAELQAKKASRDALLAKAVQANGVDRAKLLDQALVQLEADQITFGYDDLMNQIIAGDPDGAAGLKAKYTAKRKMNEWTAAIAAGKFDAVLAEIDPFLKDASIDASTRQQAYLIKATALQATWRAQLAKLFEEALAVAPESEKAADIKEILEHLKQDG